MSGPSTVDLDELTTHTGDGAVAMGLDGRIVLWNAAATALLGHDRVDVLGRPCWDVLAGRDASGTVLCQKDCAVMRRAQAGTVVDPFEMRSAVKTGTRIDLSVSTLTGHTDEPASLVILHLLRDGSNARERTTFGEPDDGAAPRLTRRELEVLALTRDGEGTRGIARRLGVSPATVRNHTQSILRKLDAHSRLQAVVVATRHRLLP